MPHIHLRSNESITTNKSIATKSLFKKSSLLLVTLLCSSAINVFAATGDEPHARHHKSHTPPQAAIDSCKSLSANDACQFSGRDNQLISGTCATNDKDSSATLACRPNHTADHKHKTEAKPDEKAE